MKKYPNNPLGSGALMPCKNTSEPAGDRVHIMPINDYNQGLQLDHEIYLNIANSIS